MVKRPNNSKVWLLIIGFIVGVLILVFIYEQNKKDPIEGRLETAAIAIKVYSIRNDKLPSSLDEVSSYKSVAELSDFSNVYLSDIEFKPTDAFNITKKFQLCANFDKDTLNDEGIPALITDFGDVGNPSTGTVDITLNNHYYSHPKGYHCFNEESIYTSQEDKSKPIRLELRTSEEK